MIEVSQQFLAVARPISLRYAGSDKLVQSYHDGAKLSAALTYHDKNVIQHGN